MDKQITKGTPQEAVPFFGLTFQNKSAIKMLEKRLLIQITQLKDAVVVAQVRFGKIYWLRGDVAKEAWQKKLNNSGERVSVTGPPVNGFTPARLPHGSSYAEYLRAVTGDNSLGLTHDFEDAIILNSPANGDVLIIRDDETHLDRADYIEKLIMQSFSRFQYATSKVAAWLYSRKSADSGIQVIDASGSRSLGMNPQARQDLDKLMGIETITL